MWTYIDGRRKKPCSENLTVSHGDGAYRDGSRVFASPTAPEPPTAAKNVFSGARCGAMVVVGPSEERIPGLTTTRANSRKS